MAAAASPPANVTAPMTAALAARTRPRRGLAASVTRTSPLRYSVVMNTAPTTVTAISAANVPASAWATVVPIPAAPGEAGAMSPDPVTANVPPACWYPPRRSAGALLTAPIDRPAHWPPRAGAPRGGPPEGARPAACRRTWSNRPVARDGPPSAPDWTIPRLAGCEYCGEVANSPAWMVRGNPARVTAATRAQWVPSAES